MTKNRTALSKVLANYKALGWTGATGVFPCSSCCNHVSKTFSWCNCSASGSPFAKLGNTCTTSETCIHESCVMSSYQLATVCLFFNLFKGLL